MTIDIERRREIGREWARRNPEARRKSAKKVQARQTASQQTATRRWVEWTTAEDAAVLRTDITMYQIAEQLGRTYGSVRMRRSKLRSELAAELEGAS